jgi:hypothetical protein
VFVLLCSPWDNDCHWEAINIQGNTGIPTHEWLAAAANLDIAAGQTAYLDGNPF